MAKNVSRTTSLPKSVIAAASESIQFFAHVAKTYDVCGQTLSAAAAYGRLANLRLTYDIMRSAGKNPLAGIRCFQSAQFGHLDCLKFLHERGCKMDKHTCPAAAGNGHLDCLKYAHEHGFLWDGETVRFAMMGGHLDCLMYAHQHACPFPVNGAVAAAEYGQLECLKYALANCPRATQVCTAAAKAGSLACLQYAAAKGCGLTRGAVACAATGGHLDCLAFLLEKGCKADRPIFVACVQGEHWESLRFLLTHDPSCADKCVDAALERNNVDCLKLFADVQVPLPASATSLAMRHNSVRCLQYLYEQGLLSWEGVGCVEASRMGSMAALRFAHEHGDPCDTYSWLAAICTTNLDYMRYLLSQHCPWDASVCEYAAKESWTEGLVFLHKHGCPWDERTCVAAAKLRGSSGAFSFQCLKYAHENGCPWSVKVARLLAGCADSTYLRYAHENGCPWDATVSKAACKSPQVLSYCVEARLPHLCRDHGDLQQEQGCYQQWSTPRTRQRRRRSL